MAAQPRAHAGVYRTPPAEEFFFEVSPPPPSVTVTVVPPMPPGLRAGIWLFLRRDVTSGTRTGPRRRARRAGRSRGGWSRARPAMARSAPRAPPPSAADGGNRPLYGAVAAEWEKKMLVCWLNAQGFPSAMVAGGVEDLRDGATLAELCDVVVRGADPSSFQLRPSDDRAPSSRFQRVLRELQAHRRDIRIPASLTGKDAAKPWADNEVCCTPLPSAARKVRRASPAPSPLCAQMLTRGRGRGRADLLAAGMLALCAWLGAQPAAPLVGDVWPK